MKAPSMWQSAVAIGLLAAALPGSALAYCAQPSAYARTPPSPPGHGRPSAPYCLSGFAFSGKHRCKQYEIESYIAGVNRYIDELNDYMAEARDFADWAVRFAEDARRFATCEAEDVRIEPK